MSERPVISEGVEIKSVKRLALIRVSVVFIIIGLMFFLPAGTLKYWQGWVYMIVIAIPMIFFGVYMFKHDPKLLERRMRIKEKREKQKLIVKLGVLPFLLAFIVPGFDRRFGWSEVSLPVTILGLALVLLGYLMTLYVFKTNSFASRVVEVEKEQKVITTGPYALVRHPMYFSMIIFYLFTPLALGSYWAVVPALSIIPVLVARIGDEEKELLDNLEGYREYSQKVKHRLIPGVW
jgi:protein-S-isoprenylcysteine O-methyltransferase Ste14